MAALSEQLRRERADLARSSHARRFEVVSLILDSAPITTGRASTQLGYDLRRRHTAAVLWTDPRRPDQAALAQAAEALGPATRARQVLTVIASSSSVWAWLAAAADTDAGALAAATAAHPAVRVAVGPAGAGIDGFRRSHFDAVATQRLMSRRPDLRVARFADVQLVTLALQDEQRAREFVARTLGQLADADRELRDTLCVYIGEQFSAARAARALYTHRNTVLNRLQRAERLLPFPLAGHGLEVGVALEIAQWLGTQPGPLSPPPLPPIFPLLPPSTLPTPVATDLKPAPSYRAVLDRPGVFSSVYFSSAIISDSRLYGTIGVVFTLLTWFIAIGAVIVPGAVAGATWDQRKGRRGTPGPGHLIAGMIPPARAREPGTHVISSDSAGDFGDHVADHPRSQLAMR